jgi:hypothetical protein
MAALPTRFPGRTSWEAKIQEMPGFFGERGGTRTLDPMIESHGFFVRQIRPAGSSRFRIRVWSTTTVRACGSDAINVLRLTDELPDIVLPYLTWAASRRPDIPARAVRILMKCCGDLFLERCLGTHRLRQLKARYPAENLSAL